MTDFSQRAAGAAVLTQAVAWRLSVHRQS